MIVNRLLAVPVGDRIPTTASLSALAEVGYGTIAGVLASLEADGVVSLTRHGHQGTLLTGRDVVGLWAAAGRGSFAGVLPLPQSPEFSGLATAFNAVADRRGLPLQLVYRQGARERFDLLGSGRVDWMVASEEARKISDLEVEARLLGDYTYYGRNSVVVITKAGRKPRRTDRVPIDRRSYDHATLTQAEFPDASFVQVPYLSIPELIVSGSVDAAVWHATSMSPLLVGSGLAIHPLRRLNPADYQGLSRASIYWRRDDGAVATLIDEVITPSAVEQVQQEVINGDRSPEY